MKIDNQVCACSCVCVSSFGYRCHSFGPRMIRFIIDTFSACALFWFFYDFGKFMAIRFGVFYFSLRLSLVSSKMGIRKKNKHKIRYHGRILSGIRWYLETETIFFFTCVYRIFTILLYDFSFYDSYLLSCTTHTHTFRYAKHVHGCYRWDLHCRMVRCSVKCGEYIDLQPNKNKIQRYVLLHGMRYAECCRWR